jgi:hypothetical protein
MPRFYCRGGFEKGRNLNSMGSDSAADVRLRRGLDSELAAQRSRIRKRGSDLPTAVVFTCGHPLEKHAKVCHFVPQFETPGGAAVGQRPIWMSSGHREMRRRFRFAERPREAGGIARRGSATFPSSRCSVSQPTHNELQRGRGLAVARWGRMPGAVVPKEFFVAETHWGFEA